MIILDGRNHDNGRVYLDESKIIGILIKPNVDETNTIRLLVEGGGIDVASRHLDLVVSILFERNKDAI